MLDLKLFVSSREWANATLAEIKFFFPEYKQIVISITEPDNYPAELDHDEEFILRLSFHDLTSRDSEYRHQLPNCTFFDEKNAEKIVSFLKIYMVAQLSILVHCEAGISRSAAVAGAILKHYTGDDKLIFSDKKYTPNMLVYSILLKALYFGDP